MTLLESLSALASLGTAVGVAVAAYQLFVARRQAMTAFEDSLNNQYRIAIGRLPVEALFGEELPKGGQDSLLPHFYRYFDLCNEQAFLHAHGRISEKTWRNWQEGIRSNLTRPAFAFAWAEIARRASGDFAALRELSPPQTVRPTR